MIPDWLLTFNEFAWVTANILVAYIAVVLIIFVVGYQLLFNPKATTAGKFIFRFTFSLIGVIALIFISLFIDPRTENYWMVYPGDVIWWRPALRVVTYAYVAYTITGLAVILVIRKWWPHKLDTATRDTQLVYERKRTK